jgi:putative transposase
MATLSPCVSPTRSTIHDEYLRSGARQLLAQAVEIEAAAFLATMKDLKLPDGRDRLVRHGHGPERTIQTGIGPVEVERVKIRDRGVAVQEALAALLGKDAPNLSPAVISRLTAEWQGEYERW